MQPSTPSGEFKEFRGLFDRDAAGEIVDAQPVDASLARTYPSFEPKGHAVAGRRITLMAPRGPFQVGEEVRVLHFYESTHSGDELHIMGPKHVYGEYVDGISAEPEPPTPEYPWMLVYDGTILPSPEVDYNFEISKYRFDSPGKHTLQWRIIGLESNVLEIEVK